MTQVWRVLDRASCPNLASYQRGGGGKGLDAARRLGPDAIIDEVLASGLRGRGGAGFPTGRKWTTVAASRSAVTPTTVVVNAAEGEPATFKDRALMRRNPYKVLEGALIAAIAVGAPQVRVGIKASAAQSYRRMARAMNEMREAGWTDGVDLSLVPGPDSYLFGEETALLEVMEGRQPFPRVTPPYRRGIEEGDTRSAGGARLAAVGGTDEAPALVDNVETLANVPGILAEGADWFRQFGTAGSPGTIICTLVGDTMREGVAEVPMGTPIAEMLELIGRGAHEKRRIELLLPGVANPLIPARLFDTPLTYEDMQAIGSGLGAAGFTAFDDTADVVAIVHGVERFLSVESCGQCEPCKRDGLAMTGHLDALRRHDATRHDLIGLNDRVSTVTDEARCFLAQQQERVVASLLRLFPDEVARHLDRQPDAAAEILIAPLLDLRGGIATLDLHNRAKQPDWSYNAEDSGILPASRLGDTPVHVRPPRLGLAPQAGVASSAGRATPVVGSSRARDGNSPEGVAVTPENVPPLGAPAAVGTSSADTGMGLEPLVQSHQRLRDLLGHLLEAAPYSDDFCETWEELDHELRLHYDINRRVLYPMARRRAGEAGEVAADDAERHELQAVHLLERIGDDAASEAAGLKELATDLQRLLDDDEQQVVPVLQKHLYPDELDDLGRGLVEARYTSREDGVY
jgi:NADH:ubiquinone oxidoreductase subunit F (NADH-binding)